MNMQASLHTGDESELYLEVSKCDPIPPTIPRPYPVVKIGTDFSWFPSDRQLIELHGMISSYVQTRAMEPQSPQTEQTQPVEVPF